MITQAIRAVLLASATVSPAALPIPGHLGKPYRIDFVIIFRNICHDFAEPSGKTGLKLPY
jgi:hypothetical protein